MYKTRIALHLCLIASVSLAQDSTKCQHQTFQNALLEVHTRTAQEEYLLSHQLITGCITPDTFLYRPGKGYLILTIKNSSIPVVRPGAVANIPDEGLWLLFSNNDMDTIEEGAFVHLPGLTVLGFTDSSIRWVEPNVFKDMLNVAHISLIGSNITHFAQNTFSNLPKLNSLDLRHNKLEYFRQEWFSGIPNLTSLYLFDNLIREIPRAAFVSLPSLKYLLLYNNLIEHVDRKAFDGAASLEILDLSRNRLKALDMDFSRTVDLINLYVSFNSISYVSDESLKSLSNKIKIVQLIANPLQCSCYERVIEWANSKNATIDWVCNEEAPVCVRPMRDPDKCIRRTQEDFVDDYQWAFPTVCPNSTYTW